MPFRTQRVVSIRPSVRPSSEALQGLFEFLLRLPRLSGPPDSLLLGLLRLPEALIDTDTLECFMRLPEAP